MSRKSQSRNTLAAKKAAVLDPKKSKRPLHLALVAVGAALVLGGGFLFLGQKGDDLPSTAQASSSDLQGADVSFPVAQFDDGESRFFEHRTGDGLTIRYFVLKSSDGVIRSAFDACDSCWHAGKGYAQDGDDMVCRNCRMRFPSVKVMEVKGGCNPSPLPNQVREGKVVIRVTDILAGRQYFDLPGRG